MGRFFQARRTAILFTITQRIVASFVRERAFVLQICEETEAALDAELKADKTAKNAGMLTRRAQAAKFP